MRPDELELICVSLLIENCADIGNDRAPGPVWDFEGWCSGALALEILPAPWRVAPRGAIEDLHEGLHDIRIVEGYRKCVPDLLDTGMRVVKDDRSWGDRDIVSI